MSNKEELLKQLNNGILRGSQAKLAGLMKVTTPTISDWFSGKKMPSEESLKKMSKIFKKSEEEIKEIFGKKEELSNIHPGRDVVSGIPVWGIASASFFRCANMSGEPIDFIPIPTTDPRMFAVKAKGDCMSPKIKNNQYVILKKQAHVDYEGQIVLAFVDEECTLKRFFNIDKDTCELRPIDTEHFEPIRRKGNEIKILGVYKGTYNKDDEI